MRFVFLVLIFASSSAFALSIKTNPTTVSVVVGWSYPAKIDEVSMPTWRKGQQVNEWRQISSTSLTSVVPNPEPPGNTGPSSKIIAWTGLALDIRNGTIYCAANGGHMDYSGNEVDKISLQDNAPKWVEVSPPTSTENITLNTEYYKDGKPTSRHSYYSHIYIESRNRAMHFGIGARWGNGGAGKPVDGFNTLTNTWDTAGTYSSIPSSNGGYVIGDARAEDPETNDVYIFGDFTIIRWNQAQNNYTTLVSNGPTIGYGAATAFDTLRKRILLRGGSNSSKCYIFDVKTSKVTQINFTGSQAAAATSGDAEGLTYEPVLDSYLLRKSGSGGAVIKISASALEAEPLPTTAGSAIPAAQNGVYTRFQYVPTLGGVFYYSTYTANIWFLRTN